jgi:hypothetical protein
LSSSFQCSITRRACICVDTHASACSDFQPRIQRRGSDAEFERSSISSAASLRSRLAKTKTVVVVLCDLTRVIECFRKSPEPQQPLDMAEFMVQVEIWSRTIQVKADPMLAPGPELPSPVEEKSDTPPARTTCIPYQRQSPRHPGSSLEC